MSDLLQRATDIFFKVCDLPGAEQEPEVRRLSSGDESLAGKALEILAGDRAPDLRLEVPALGRLSAGEVADLEEQVGGQSRGGTGRGGKKTEARRLDAGQLLGDFEIECLLAQGGMGEVYRARQRSLGGRQVALKVLVHPEQDEKAVTRFNREALLLADVHHPSLADVYGFGEVDGVMFIAMRLVEGATLQQVHEQWRASRGALSTPEQRSDMLHWMIQVLEGLSRIHAQGLIHRDVKPANIIIEGFGGSTSSMRAVLVDYGLIKSLRHDQRTLTGMAAATPAYAPPELLLGHEVDARSDVFSAGVTLHDLLSGREPSEREAATSGLRRLDEIIEGCSADLSAVMAKATHLDPHWRYADAGALLSDLRALVAGKETSARRRLPLERAERWITTHAGRLLSGILAAALLTLGLFAVKSLLAGQVHAKAARAAFARGDVREVLEQADRIPTLYQSLFATEDLEAFRNVPLGHNSPVTAGRIAWHSASGDFEAAMCETVTDARLHGLSSRPLLTHYIEHALRSRDPSGSLTSRAETAVRFTGRLFYERPAQDDRESAASASLRTALLEILEQTERQSTASRYALTALSGCGTGPDVCLILDHALAAPPFSEAERLGLKTAERILARCLAMQTNDTIELERVSRQMKELAARLLPQADVSWFASLEDIDSSTAIRRQSLFAHFGTVMPLAFLARAAKQTRCIAPLEAQYATATAKGTLPITFLLEIRAVLDDPSLRDPEIRPLLESWTRPDFPDKIDFRSLGRLSGYVGDPDFTAHLRSLLASAWGADEQASFSQGLQAGTLEREGRRNITYDLDKDTLLGAPTSGWEEIAFERTSAPGTETTIAGWNFQSSPAQYAGAATAARMKAGRRQTTERATASYLRLAPAQSEASLRLFLEAPPDNDLQLTLDVQAAARGYFPLLGEAYLEIELDGRLLQEAWRFGLETPHPISIAVSRLFLDRGEHEIRLRMDPKSTTTLRVFSITLVAD